MNTVISAIAAAAVALGTVVAWSPWSSAAGSTKTGYEPALNPADFSTKITNPYFPLPVGRQLIYKGTKDGKTQRDVVTVTDRTKLTAEGIRARIVTDVAKHNGTLLEKTQDWYAQDKAGNVWYVGEKTADYTSGTLDTSGSWEAGVNDGEPGIVMKAHPHIPQAYRQEYLRGEAEDTAWVVRTHGSITVPFATFKHVTLVTLEAARIEPGAYDKKIYAPGYGIVYENAITGEPEISKLVKVTG